MTTLTQEQIIEGNKLIANFKGWIWPEDAEYRLYEEHALKYHSSWHWLMPVIEKIESIGWQVCIDTGICHIYPNTIPYEMKDIEFANKSNNNTLYHERTKVFSISSRSNRYGKELL